MAAMKLGYLHLGRSHHGVNRYGRMLAGEARGREGVEVVEESLILTGRRRDDRAALSQAADRLSGCDLVHLQYNRSLWGEGRSQLFALRCFTANCRVPMVASLHDIYLDNPWEGWKRRTRSPVRRLRKWYRLARRRQLVRRAVHLILDRCERVLVCFEQERERLRFFRQEKKIKVVGHFVEQRENLPDRQESRLLLGVGSWRVVTMLGFIHPRKGYDLVIEALELLPKDVLVVFAGAASEGNERALKRWEKKAAKMGQDNRLQVTGYLEDEQQARWLVATDLAVCPFRFFSASGSMATWFSVGTPVLCHALPQVDEYRAVSKNAFFTFSPYTKEAFASAVAAALDRVSGEPDPSILALRDHYSIRNMVDKHLDCYREALEEPSR
ncbi:MAG: glycosyltransferase [Planctomycetota bacterium]